MGYSFYVEFHHRLPIPFLCDFFEEKRTKVKK